MTARFLALGARLVSGAQVRWLHRPAAPEPRVYFANHSSHLDFVVLWAVLPATIRRRTRPVAAQEYWQSTALRWWVARAFRSLLVPRTEAGGLAGRATLAPLLAELDRGGSLILFPEGTRGSGAEIAAFHGGLYQLCRQRPEVEAVPVYLENLNRILPKGQILPMPGRSRVTFGAPLRLDGTEGVQDFLGRARAALLDLSRQ